MTNMAHRLTCMQTRPRLHNHMQMLRMQKYIYLEVDIMGSFNHNGRYSCTLSKEVLTQN